MPEQILSKGLKYKRIVYTQMFQGYLAFLLFVNCTEMAGLVIPIFIAYYLIFPVFSTEILKFVNTS